MLAKRLPSILPARFHFMRRLKQQRFILLQARPSRTRVWCLFVRFVPRTIQFLMSLWSVEGGVPQPGEISLAHNGVLFLDELPEFKRTVLEVMRQPLEERRVTISRAKFSVEYPASFMLVSAMNPCPCGYYNHPEKDCVCAPGVVQKYLNKVSGPLLDRIDIHLEVTPVPFLKN